MRDPETVQIIAANLRRLMDDRAKPFTQQSLAKAAHVQQSAVCRILNAKTSLLFAFFCGFAKPSAAISSNCSEKSPKKFCRSARNWP